MTIQQILSNIRNAVYGKDVRSSIHDGIDQCYKDRLPGGMNPVPDLNNFPSGLALFTSTALNKPFDPNFHEAVMHVEDENYGEKEVVEVFRKGYKIGDKIIRHTMVKVAN